MGEPAHRPSIKSGLLFRPSRQFPCRWTRRVRSPRGQATPVSETDRVYPANPGGDLPLMLAPADLAFVGGSLVKIGGHNLLEPAALGKPCLTGPAYFNFSDITRQLVAQGGAAVVADADALGDKVNALLGDAGARRQMGEQARAVVLRNQGALARTLSHCLAALEND